MFDHACPMTQEELIAIMALRQKGYAVITWSPKELQGVDPDIIENESVTFGHELIVSTAFENGAAP